MEGEFWILIVKVDSKYCDYLKKFDTRVSYNKDKRELSPFIGVLFKIGDIEYFAPLTSPKPKHLKMRNTIDFLRINQGIWGAINFNTSANYEVIDLNRKITNKKDLQYHELLKNQYVWLNEHKKEIKNRATNLYTKYIYNKIPENIKNRCCNFPVLEEACFKYNSVLV